jgi:hypothetical protein
VLEHNPFDWRCVSLVVANTHKVKEGALSDLVVTNTSGIRQKRGALVIWL